MTYPGQEEFDEPDPTLDNCQVCGMTDGCECPRKERT